MRLETHRLYRSGYGRIYLVLATNLQMEFYTCKAVNLETRNVSLFDSNGRYSSRNRSDADLLEEYTPPHVQKLKDRVTYLELRLQEQRVRIN